MPKEIKSTRPTIHEGAILNLATGEIRPVGQKKPLTDAQIESVLRELAAHAGLTLRR